MENTDTTETKVSDTQQPKQEKTQDVQQQPESIAVEVIPKVIKDYVDGMVASAMDRILSTPAKTDENKDDVSNDETQQQKASYIL